jgi:hypothetical protein
VCPGQPLCRQLAQLIVDERQELLGGVRIAVYDGGQDARDIIHPLQHTCDARQPQGNAASNRKRLQSKGSCKGLGQKPQLDLRLFRATGAFISPNIPNAKSRPRLTINVRYWQLLGYERSVRQAETPPIQYRPKQEIIGRSRVSRPSV